MAQKYTNNNNGWQNPHYFQTKEGVPTNKKKREEKANGKQMPSPKNKLSQIKCETPEHYTLYPQ